MGQTRVKKVMKGQIRTQVLEKTNMAILKVRMALPKKTNMALLKKIRMALPKKTNNPSLLKKIKMAVIKKTKMALLKKIKMVVIKKIKIEQEKQENIIMVIMDSCDLQQIIRHQICIRGINMSM